MSDDLRDLLRLVRDMALCAALFTLWVGAGTLLMIIAGAT